MAPGKHKQKSKKTKPSASASAAQSEAAATAKQEGFTSDIANADGWNAVVDRLCEYLKLPGESFDGLPRDTTLMFHLLL